MSGSSSSPNIADLGTILCVFAHPDDETCTMGGLMLLARRNGQRVICLTATRGESGVQDESKWPAERLPQIRSRELAEALGTLGQGIQHHFLDYVDGQCSEVDPGGAASKIAGYIRQYQPDSVFSFGPDGFTGHPDHRAVSSWAQVGLEQSGQRADLYQAALSKKQYQGLRSADSAMNVFFATDSPQIVENEELAICLDLDDDVLDTKLKALRAMPSQYESLFNQLDIADIKLGFRYECFAEVSS